MDGRDLRSLSLSCSRGLSLTLSLSRFGDGFLFPGEKECAFGSLWTGDLLLLANIKPSPLAKKSEMYTKMDIQQ
jgi:hypothetical protein